MKIKTKTILIVLLVVLLAEATSVFAQENASGISCPQIPATIDILTSETVGTALGQQYDVYIDKTEYVKADRVDLFRTAFSLVDISRTAGTVLGHMAEGDIPGVKAAFFGDLRKKGLAAAGAAAMSVIPGVGTVAGAFAGEAFYYNAIQPLEEKIAQEEREKLAEDKYMNKPWLQPTIYMNQNGTHELPIDMYFDKNGQIKRRSIAEQKAYENQRRIEWLDTKKKAQFLSKLEKGEISKQEYDKAMAHYKNRDPSKPWDPESWQPSMSFDPEDYMSPEEYSRLQNEIDENLAGARKNLEEQKKLVEEIRKLKSK